MSQAPHPKTIHDELVAALNALIAEGRLVANTDMRWKRIQRETNALMKADACLAWVTLGDLHSMSGEKSQMDACFKNALKIRHDELLYEHWAASLLNIGQVLEAQQLLAERCSPRLGKFTSKISLIQASGAFHLLHSAYEEAKVVGVDVSAYRDDIERTAAIVKLLDEAGLSDEDVGRAIALVVQLIVKRGYFAHGAPIISVADEPGVFRGVTFMLRTPFTGNEFLELAQDIVLAEEASHDLRKHALFDVGILPAPTFSSASTTIEASSQ